MQMTLIATLIPAHPSLNEMLMFSALGFTVVIIVLASLSIVTAVIGKFFVAVDKMKKSFGEKSSAKTSASPLAGVKGAENIPTDHAFAISAAVASVLPDLQADSAELIAVIAAAATEALDADVRVVSLKPVDMSYAMQGRAQMFAAKNYTPVRM